MAQSKAKKVSLDQIVHLVEQLPADEQEQLLRTLNMMAKAQTSSTTERHPFLDSHIDIELLAAQQGVPESTSLDDLKGDFWPADEDMEEFVTTVRRWRQESSGRR